MTSAHESETCQKTIPMQWVTEDTGETIHLQIGSGKWIVQAEGTGDLKAGVKRNRFYGRGGTGKRIPRKERIFHLRVWHIHCYLRWKKKKSLKKAPLVNKFGYIW